MKRKPGTLTADEALARIGDDPATLILAIQIMERMRWQRLQAKRKRK